MSSISTPSRARVPPARPGVVASCALALALSCVKQPVGTSSPRIEQVDRYSAMLTWSTARSLSDRIQWRCDSSWQTIQDSAAVKIHCVKVAGLLPDHTYRYRIGSAPDREYAFRTAPSNESPFRFCVLGPAPVDSAALAHVLPDFAIAPGDSAAAERVRVALGGLTARIVVRSAPFAFAWGSARLVSTPQSARQDSVAEGVLLAFGDSPAAALSGRSSAAVVFAAGGDSVRAVDTLGTTLVSTGPRGLLVEVQGADVRAAAIGTGRAGELTMALHRGPLTYARTCVYCRRLLEDQQYRRSIEYYRRFVDEGGEQALHDDALYQIGHIYDRYLFDYPHALEAYDQLVTRFASSSLAATAKFRSDYVRAHADSAYAPLAAFERAHLTMTQEHAAQAAADVARLLERYPSCTLRGEILLWLGTALELDKPTSAIGYLQTAAKEATDADARGQALMKVGDIQYHWSRYRSAQVSYRAAMAASPTLSSSVSVKIARSKRNLLRLVIVWSAGVFMLCVAFGIGMARPRGFAVPPLAPFGVFVALYAVAGAIALCVLVDYRSELAGFVAAMIGAMALVGYLVIEFSRKAAARGVRLWVRLGAAVTASLILTLAALYILLQVFHYLFVFERKIS